jgi:predicted acylesterase/phospholipase RssA
VKKLDRFYDSPWGLAFLLIALWTYLRILRVLLEGGWYGFLVGIFLWTCQLSVLMVGASLLAIKGPEWLAFGALLGCFWGFESLTIGRLSLTDLLIVAAVASFPIARLRNRPNATMWQRRYFALQMWLCSIVISWFALSVHDAFAPSKAVRLPGQANLTKMRTFGLALSGGGYRAALYHSGVVAGLESFGVQPDSLSAVSGGAIFGSYYILGGESTAFRALLSSQTLNIYRRLARMDVALKLVFLPSYTRTNAQAELLDDAFIQNHQLDRLSPTMPFVIGTSSLNGGLVGLTQFGALLISTNTGVSTGGLDFIVATDMASGHMPLSYAVAASGAFPGALRAQPIRLRDSKQPFDIEVTQPSAQLADGGLIDNSGLLALRALQGQTTGGALVPRVMISSDASAFPSQGERYGSVDEVEGTLDGVYEITQARSRAESRGWNIQIVAISPMQLFFNPTHGSGLTLLRMENNWSEMRRCNYYRQANFAMLSYRSSTGTRFSLEHLDEDALRTIQAFWRSDHQPRAVHIVDEVIANRVRTKSHHQVVGPPAHDSTGECDAGSSAEEQLYHYLRDEMAKDAAAFDAAGTLQIQFASAQAEQIYRLGYLLTQFLKAEIVAALTV